MPGHYIPVSFLIAGRVPPGEGCEVKQVSVTAGIQTWAFEWTRSSYQKFPSGERKARMLTCICINKYWKDT